ncbi:MAG TPA: DUF6600 domain-containing protein [Chitinophagaceae bacterium]|nr:DUF6600 domain-containing protein [Chitinophagaceae bacterium]
MSPYGRWIDYTEYGFVWVPNVGHGFRPYSTNGHWVWTDNYQWMWVSGYDWGWAPFHYGRWLFDPFYGWIWVPGYEWSPAWVAWRSGGDYYGWAPLWPGVHISINFSIGRYSPPYDYWCFAPRRYITSHRIYDYCYDRRQNITIINQTTIINNYNYSQNVFRTGPSRYEAERYTGRIAPVRFRESSRPGRTQFRNNEVSVYRPSVQRDNERRFTPRNFDRYDRQGIAGGERINRGTNQTDRNSNADGRIERNNDFRRNNNDTRVNGNGNNLPRRESTGNPPVDRPSIGAPGRDRTEGGRVRSDFNRNNNRDSREPRTQANNRTEGNAYPGSRPPEERRPQAVPDRQPSRQFERGNGVERRNQAPAREQARESRSPATHGDAQVERRQPAAPSQQPQQRQVEPREQENRSQGNRDVNNGNNNGNGRGRGRF